LPKTSEHYPARRYHSTRSPSSGSSE
jgi:hypothetical protein